VIDAIDVAVVAVAGPDDAGPDDAGLDEQAATARDPAIARLTANAARRRTG
jgi:hypothetical protein